MKEFIKKKMTRSLLCLKGINSNETLKNWIEERNKKIIVNVDKVAFQELVGWNVSNNGNIQHNSGKFFSIEGIKVETDFWGSKSWYQPIINQPEIGFLGIIAQEINGTLHFLMQSKIEPGNINSVQISPTLQATKSNYSQVHRGSKPRFLDYFKNVNPRNIILDQLQSEQGARFLKKRNRNIIILVEEKIEITEDFKWMTLGQIKKLMSYDNLVNMDTRTVISGINFSFQKDIFENKLDQKSIDLMNSMKAKEGLFSIANHLSWLSGLKSKYELNVTRIPLNEVKEWKWTSNSFQHIDELFFKVIGVKVTISNREVKSWYQPLIQPMQDGVCGFIVKKIEGVLHFLVQAKLECGNFDILELAPTVQCLTGNIKHQNFQKPLFYDELMHFMKKSTIYDTKLSEEGGRFYHEENRNIIVEADQTFSDKVPEHFTWMTLGQLYEFLRFNNYLNIQSRSLLSTLTLKYEKI